MSTEIDTKLLEKLSLMLYPECLDFSKVITILSEDFTFTGNDLYSLKEISKIFQSKDLLFNYLSFLSKQKNPIIVVNEDFSKCQIMINDKMVYYQFINIPTDFNSERLKLLLGLNDEDYIRLYKSSIFWVLIIENEEFNKKFEATLKDIFIDKDKKLKYNITDSYMIKKIAKKQIDKRIYNQETKYLKINGKNGGKNNDFNRGKKNDDSMCWRKKSDTSNDQDNLGYLGYEFNKNYGNKRRQRFKSDPYEYQGNEFYNSKKNNINNDYQKDIDDLREQLDDVKYPIFIKEKYSNNEILDYFDSIKNDIKFEEKNFLKIVDDIIDRNKMKSLELENKKEYEIPKNNPLLNFRKGK